MIKDTDQQLEEKIHRVRSGRVLSTGTSVPMQLGSITLLVCGCMHPPGSSLCSIGILWRLSHRHDPLVSPFITPLSSLKDGGGGMKILSFNCGLVFLVMVLMQEPAHSCLRRTKDTPDILIT